MCNEKINEKTELTDEDITNLWLDTKLEDVDYNWTKKILVVARKIIQQDRKLRQNN